MEFLLPEGKEWKNWWTSFNGKKSVSGRLSKQMQRLSKVVGKMDTRVVQPFSLSSTAKVWDDGRARTTIAFSLPPGVSCNGFTKTCADACYACAGNHVYANVIKLQIRNMVRLRFFELLHEDLTFFEPSIPFTSKAEVLDFIVTELARLLCSYSYIPLFRIHEAGDFYSQFQCEVWAGAITLARQWRGDFFVTTYTRSFELDFGSLLNAGLRLYASQDTDNWEEAEEFSQRYGVPTAIGPVGENFEYDPTTHVVCPATNGEYDTYRNACRRCGLCYGIRQRFQKVGDDTVWTNEFKPVNSDYGIIFLKH